MDDVSDDVSSVKLYFCTVTVSYSVSSCTRQRNNFTRYVCGIVESEVANCELGNNLRLP